MIIGGSQTSRMRSSRKFGTRERRSAGWVSGFSRKARVERGRVLGRGKRYLLVMGGDSGVLGRVKGVEMKAESDHVAHSKSITHPISLFCSMPYSNPFQDPQFPLLTPIAPFPSHLSCTLLFTARQSRTALCSFPKLQSSTVFAKHGTIKSVPGTPCSFSNLSCNSL